MEQYRLYKGDDGRIKLDVPFRSYELIRRPLYNKGTGFTPEDRRSFALEGLLPSQHNPIELQARRIYASIRRLRAVTHEVATAVMQRVRDDGIGEPLSDAQIGQRIDESLWEPVYPDFVPV